VQVVCGTTSLPEAPHPDVKLYKQQVAAQAVIALSRRGRRLFMNAIVAFLDKHEKPVHVLRTVWAAATAACHIGDGTMSHVREVVFEGVPSAMKVSGSIQP
jgi:hypothetical protein